MKTIVSALFLLACLICRAQPPVEWAAPMGSATSDAVFDMVIDGEGNTYITGYFNGDMDIDPGQAEIIISSNGTQNMYVQKLNSQGELEWYYNLTSGSVTYGYGIAVDLNGNVYVCGYFQSAADFDTGSGTSYLFANGISGGYLLKLNSVGEFVWVKGFLPTGSGDANNVVFDGNNSLYVSGYYAGTLDANPGAAENNLTSTGGLDCYVVKINVAGNYLWSGSIGADAYQLIKLLAVDNNGDLYMAGDYVGTGDFDPTAGTVTFTADLTTEGFVIKMTSSGNFVYAQSIGGSGSDEIDDLAIDANNNLLVSGQFENTVDFDSGSGIAELTALAYADIFILKLDPSGNTLWVHGLGSTINDVESAICTDQNNNFYVSVGVNYSMDFDFDPNNAQTAQGLELSSDIAVAKYTENAELLWLTSYGGNGYENPKNIKALHEDVLYISGLFSGTAVLSTNANLNQFEAVGGDDVFTLRMSCMTYGLETVTACGSFYWPITDQNYTDDGIYTGSTANMAGCDSLITLELTITSVSNAVVQSGTTLTAQQDGATYQWLDCNLKGSEIEGETGQSFTASSNGSYAVQITWNECSVYSDCFNFTDIGIYENEQKDIQLMPNPAHDQLIISSTEMIQDITILDVLGNIVQTQNSHTQKATIPIVMLAPGSYFAQAKMLDGSIIRKAFIKD